MKLSETAIRRPVLASMLSAALVLFGFIGYTRLSVRELPDIDPPIISVSTVLPGANAQVVETAVTDVLEEELSTIQGIRTLSSTSSEQTRDRKSTRLNSSHLVISYAVFCLKKKKPTSLSHTLLGSALLTLTGSRLNRACIWRVCSALPQTMTQRYLVSLLLQASERNNVTTH